MPRRGRMTVKGVTYIQFSCPFYYGRHKPDLLLCPAGHPKFTKQKGCNYLWRITDSIRDQIPYGTEAFKEHYNRRTAIERIFSRLLAIMIQSYERIDSLPLNHREESTLIPILRQASCSACPPPNTTAAAIKGARRQA